MGHMSGNYLDLLPVGGKLYHYYSLAKACKKWGDLSKLPFSLKILLENLLRHEDGTTVKSNDIEAFMTWLKNRHVNHEIAFRATRVLMQDFTGVPAIVDLAAMREAIQRMGGHPDVINPLSPVDLVIDHSVMVDHFGSPEAFKENVEIEYERNKERYAFLRWGQQSFNNFRVVPPGTGICHQVNLEYLSQTVWTKEIDDVLYAFPDSLVGTDSHTTMVNGLSVLGWGVGGIEAEAAMLGQPISMLIPEVIGFRLEGALKEGATATDLVLTVTHMLRKKGVVGKFVEFYGPGLSQLSLADRATIANMAPEYGATCGFFPVDQETLRYLKFTGRDAHRVDLVEAYAKAQGLWYDENTPDPVFTDTLMLSLEEVESSLAGPRRPHDKVRLSDMPTAANQAIESLEIDQDQSIAVHDFQLTHGDVVIAAITSCTNTSNPSVMLGAAMLAHNAYKQGLTVKPWVKTSLAPGSKVVTDYLKKSGYLEDFEKLGFHVVGYGCTTCIGNSGPLPSAIAEAIDKGSLAVASVLSGNRNFEGRIHPQVPLNYLASPMLVVAYALAGNIKHDLYRQPLGQNQEGKPIYLQDIWPTNAQIAEAIQRDLTPEMFQKNYAEVFQGDHHWKQLSDSESLTYAWDQDSTYVKHPTFFHDMEEQPMPVHNIKGARILALLGDSITTDHISPAGSIQADSPAGRYLQDRGVKREDFNAYGARRGNHEIMMRGTFANIRLHNEMLPGTRGGITRHIPSGEILPIYDASMAYQAEGVPLIVVAGREYGSGSSRDWAAKGTRLLGVKAVIAESFERIHRSNLIGMGVLPLMFKDGTTRLTLHLNGNEVFDIQGLDKPLVPGMELECHIHYADGHTQTIPLRACLDTANEVEYFRHGGILHYVLRNLLKESQAA